MNNLSSIAEKLAQGKWLIKPSAHVQMCKALDAYMKNPSMKMDDNVQTRYALGESSTVGDSNVHGIIYVSGIFSKGVTEAEEALLGLVDVDWVRAAIDQLAADPSVQDIIVCWASPGGETTGIEELGRRIVDIDETIKPIYSWCENQADSAAYWLSSQARMYGMAPSAQVGGVGVYVLVTDETKRLEMEGVSIEPISSGKYKMLGHEFRSLTKEERQILQDDVDKQHGLFKATVKARRPNVSGDDMEGLSFNGQDALQKGFVDCLYDNLSDFIGRIDNQADENIMKPQVEKVKAMAANATAKNEPVAEVAVAASSPEVSLTEQFEKHFQEPIEPETRFRAFLSKIKEIMGSYDGQYSAVPGVPGTEENSEPVNTPEGTPSIPQLDPENYARAANGDGSDNDECDDMEQCSHCQGSGKMKKAKEEAEKKEPVVAEGKYDGGYEKAASGPITREAFMKSCGMTVPPAISPQMESWKKACGEVFTGTIFDGKQ